MHDCLEDKEPEPGCAYQSKDRTAECTENHKAPLQVGSPQFGRLIVFRGTQLHRSRLPLWGQRLLVQAHLC